MTTTYEQIKKRAYALKDERCHAFPNIICDEVKGLPFKSWCEPCQARNIVKVIEKVKKSK